MNILELLRKDIEKHFNVDLKDKSRKRDIVSGRIAFAYIARNHLKLTYQSISDYFGFYGHANIVHYCKSFDCLYKYDKNFRFHYDLLDLDNYLIIDKASIEKELERLNVKRELLQERLRDLDKQIGNPNKNLMLDDAV